MSSGDLLDIEPAQLMFPFKLTRQSSCCLQLTNKTDEYVAFKIKSSNKKKYGALPNTGIVLPRTACYVTVTMRAQKEAPKDMQCKDKFVIQSVTAQSGATEKDITREMFKKESGKVVKEFKLRAFYVPANPLVPPQGSAPRASVVENGSQGTSLFNAASNSLLMSMSSILSIQPTELKFPFELKNPSSCSLQLTNKSDEYVPPAPEGSSPRACLMENESQGTSVFDAVHGFFSSHFQWKKRNNPLTTPLLTSNRDGR